jgi:uncharacterized protein (DUF433 family)
MEVRTMSKIVWRTPDSWIQKTPNVCGGDACIRNTRISVPGLVEWKKLGRTDARLLEGYPGLTQADLDAAWAYYEANPDEIEQAIKEDEEAMSHD